jgi:prepilin-type N-terminal cleavage/methylation domain-containing protein
MKKGFTLIELLAVIVILGIIIFVAVPAINTLISETKYKTFKTNMDSSFKAIEDTCKSNLMSKENNTFIYTFNNGISNFKIDAKGKLPDDGYIMLDKQCNIVNYYLEKDNSIYSNSEDVREDYMLKAPTNSESIFKTMYPEHYNKLLTINFVKHLNIPENAVEIKDPSISEKGKIKSWLIPNGENFDFYVGSEGTIYANYNSQRLFYALGVTTNIFLENFDTSFTTNMSRLFSASGILQNVDISNFNTYNVVDMSLMFHECYQLNEINLSNFNTSNVTTMNSMFRRANNLTELDVSTFDTSKVTDMYGLFSGGDINDYKLKRIVGLENWDTSNVTDISLMFYRRRNLEYIDVSNFDTSKVTNIKHLFAFDDKMKSLDLSSWDLNNVTSKDNLFGGCGVNHIVTNISNINIISPTLPSRVSTTPGTIEIIGDKQNFDASELTSKNWNII